MAKRTYIGYIGVTPTGALEVREDSFFEEGGERSATTHHRYVLQPGDPLPSGRPVDLARVKAIAEAVWTPSVLADHRARLKAAEHVVKPEI